MPSNSRKLLLLSTLEALMAKVIIRSLPGINRCMIGEPAKNSTTPVLQTEGVNIKEMWKVCAQLLRPAPLIADASVGKVEAIGNHCHS
jgi:hypothetical protein